MKLRVVLTLAACACSSAAATNAGGISQGSRWFSDVTAQVLANLTSDYNQFQQMVADRTAQLTKALQDAENGNAVVESQSAALQQEIVALQRNIVGLKGRASYTTQENQHLRKNLQILSDKMRAAQAAAEAAVEGSDGGEAAAIAAAESTSPSTTMLLPLQPSLGSLGNQQPSPMQPLFPSHQSPSMQPIFGKQQLAVMQPAISNAGPQGGDLVDQPHSADEDDADENDDANSQQDSAVQSAVQQALPAVNAVSGLAPASTDKQSQPLSQLQQPSSQQQQQVEELQDREQDGYNVAFESDDMVDPDAGYSFLETRRVPLGRRNMLRRGRASAIQLRSQVVNSGGQVVALLTQGAEQYAQQEEYNVATLQNSFQGAMVLLTRKHAELLSQHEKLVTKRDSLHALHARLSTAVNKLEATRGHLQKHVAELEKMFRTTPSVMATSESR